MKNNTRMLFAIIGTSLLLGAHDAMAQAQPAQTTQAQSAATQSGGNAGQNTFGGFVGFTDRRDADFTMGLRFEHAMSNNWSAGALVEHTPNYFRSEDATLLLGTANYRPDFNQRLKFTGGAGVEFKDIEGDDVVFRTGVAYDVFLEGPLSLAPNIDFNFGENDESLTVGANLMYRF